MNPYLIMVAVLQKAKHVSWHLYGTKHKQVSPCLSALNATSSIQNSFTFIHSLSPSLSFFVHSMWKVLRSGFVGVIVTRLMSFFARREALATYVSPAPLSLCTAPCASGGALSPASAVVDVSLDFFSTLCFSRLWDLTEQKRKGSPVFLRMSGQEWSRFLWVFRLLFDGFVWAWYKSNPVEGITTAATVVVCAVTLSRV